METLSFEFPAGQPPMGRALVGCVGSGDLEVLLEPGLPGKLSIQVVFGALAAFVRAHVRRAEPAGHEH
jgi:malonate decarboxylase delta subunit